MEDSDIQERLDNNGTIFVESKDDKTIEATLPYYLQGTIAGPTSTEVSEDPNFSVIKDLLSEGTGLTKDEREKRQKYSCMRYDADPNYRGVIDAFLVFIIGRGFQVKAEDESEEVQAYLDEFIKINKFDGRDRDIVLKVLKTGEAFIRFFTKAGAQIARYPVIRVFNYSDIPEIETQEDDRETVINYKHVYKKKGTQSEMGSEDIKPEEIVHIKFGDTDAVRGRPPLDVIAQHCQYYLDWLHNRIVFNRLKTAYYLEEIIDGSPAATTTQKDSSTIGNRKSKSGKDILRMPKAGSKLVHNKSIEYKWLSPDVKADDAKEDGHAIRLAICAGAQIPEFVLGDASNAAYACHDSETELLTRRGWLKYNEIHYGDIAGTMNPTTKEFEWQQIGTIYNYDYDGELIRFKSRDIDILVTPNHKMYITRQQCRRLGGRKGKLIRTGLKQFKFMEAKETKFGDILPSYCVPNKKMAELKQIIIPGVPHLRYYIDSFSHPQNKTVQMDVFLKWLGWWISEGWTTTITEGHHSYTVGVSQKATSVNACNEIRNIMKSLNYNYNEIHSKNGMTEWTINDKSLWCWLRSNCGIGAYGKKLPDFIYELPDTQQKLLIESMIKGDGSVRKSGSFTYFTVSKELADGMQTICHQCGYVTAICRNNSNGVIPISIKKPGRKIKLSRNHISKVPYRGNVWCVAVPNGIIITRRNGKTTISGNSTLVSQNPFVRKNEYFQDFFEAHFKHIFEKALAYGKNHGFISKNSYETIERIEKPGFWRKIKARAGNMLAPSMQAVQEKATGSIIREQLDDKGAAVTRRIIPTKTTVKIQFPNLIAQNVLEDTQAAQIHQGMGIASSRTLAEKFGYNYDEEQKRMAQEDEGPEAEPDQDDMGGEKREEEIKKIEALKVISKKEFEEN